MMPFGISGNSMESFLQRIWINFPFQIPGAIQSNGGVMQTSAPESLVDFATSDGGNIFTSNDRFLKKQFVNIRQSNGYLYPIGDSSVSVISNVQTGGSPTTTTFSYQNVDPQVGAAWRDTLQDFSTTILFGNGLGIYGVYGGRALKVSKDIDQLFQPETAPNLGQLVLPAAGGLTPSSAVATLFNVKHYLALFSASVNVGPFGAAPRPVMIAWNEKEWTILSQSVDLTYIATQEVSSQLYAWGTDGASVYPLFTTPSSSLMKVLQTKLYGANMNYVIKDTFAFMLQAQDRSQGQVGVSGVVSIDTSGIEPQAANAPSVPSTSVPALVQQPAFPAEPPFWPVYGTGVTGVPGLNIGATFVTAAPDFVISAFMLSYTDATGFGG
jgi:hypothetical protein